MPSARVFTAMAFDPTPPYVVITKRADRPISRHHDGSAVDTVDLRMELYHHNYDEGHEVVGQIKCTFDDNRFALAGADRVLNMQRTNDSAESVNDRVWKFVVDFACTVYLAEGC